MSAGAWQPWVWGIMSWGGRGSPGFSAVITLTHLVRAAPAPSRAQGFVHPAGRGRGPGVIRRRREAFSSGGCANVKWWQIAALRGGCTRPRPPPRGDAPHATAPHTPRAPLRTSQLRGERAALPVPRPAKAATGPRVLRVSRVPAPARRRLRAPVGAAGAGIPAPLRPRRRHWDRVGGRHAEGQRRVGETATKAGREADRGTDARESGLQSLRGVPVRAAPLRVLPAPPHSGTWARRGGRGGFCVSARRRALRLAARRLVPCASVYPSEKCVHWRGVGFWA